MTKLSGKAKQRASLKERRNKDRDYETFKAKTLVEIRTGDDPALSTICDPVIPVDGKLSEQDIQLIKKLKRTLAFTPNGAGLSANQIGITKRVCVTRNKVDDKNIKVYINPEITEHGEGTFTSQEGCLSYPGIFANIERIDMITVKYLDEELKECEVYLKGFLSAVVQHEIDHINFGRCRVKEEWLKQQSKVVEEKSEIA